MRRPILVMAVAVMTASAIGAQEEQSAGWPVGARVRVWTDTASTVVGQLIDVRNDTLIVDDKPQVSRRPYVRVPVSSTIRLEVSDGRHVSARNVAWGTLGGAAAGLFAAGFVVDVLWDEFCPVDCGDPDPDYGRLTLIGAGLGALIGAARRVDDWREVRTPARPIIAPSSRGATVGISFSFR